MMLDRIVRISLAAILAVLVVWIVSRHIGATPEGLARWFLAAGLFAPLAFAAFFAVATVAPIPASLLILAGGALFGPLWGTALSLIGATAGAMLAFLVARYLVSDWVQERGGRRVGRVLNYVEREGWRFVAYCRLVPVLPFFLLNYAFGVTRIRLTHYTLATAVCLLPSVACYSYVGYVGREAWTGGADLPQKALLGVGLLVVLVCVARFARRRKPIAAGENC